MLARVCGCGFAAVKGPHGKLLTAHLCQDATELRRTLGGLAHHRIDILQKKQSKDERKVLHSQTHLAPSPS